jgi:hypothetical protein
VTGVTDLECGREISMLALGTAFSDTLRAIDTADTKALKTALQLARLRGHHQLARSLL